MSVSYGEPAVVFQGLSLNAFEVLCDPYELSRFRVPEEARKRDLRGRFGTGDVFIEDGWAYVAGSSSAPDAEVVALKPEDDEQLLVFMLREALAQHARDQGFVQWFTMGHELHVAGLPGDQVVGPVRVQRALRLRVTREGVPEKETWLVARHDTRWLLAGSLADTPLRDEVAGEYVERLAGNGPRRAKALRVTEAGVSLRVGEVERLHPLSDYTLSIGSFFVRRHLGVDVLRGLMTASGALTQRGQRNRYAVADRTNAMVSSLDAFGWEFSVPGGGRAAIARRSTEIRVQARS